MLIGCAGMALHWVTGPSGIEGGGRVTLRFQDWRVDPALNQVRRGDEIVHLEPLTMNVLVCLLEHVDEVVAPASLLDRYWSGRHADPGMVARCVRQIRRALGDDARAPRYLETIHKRGYRAIGPAGAIHQPVATDVPVAESETALGIGVMPFDDLSPGGDQGWLAQGITEELIEFLCRIPGLHVPARASAEVLKRQNADVDAIAGRLNVSTIVDGSVRRDGERITVLVRWYRAADQRRLWSARLQRQLEDVFAVQKEIAAGIAEAIREELGVRDAAPFLAEYRYQTSNARAWELFHRGFDLVFTFQPERMAEGQALLEQALHYDPDYLAARVLLAWSEFDRPDHRVDVAQQALARDPANVIAYRILLSDCIAQYDFDTALRLWERAAARKPRDNSLALIGYHLFSSLGDLSRALAVTRQGVRLDPLWNTHHYFLGLAHLNLGQPEAAIEPLRRGIELFPISGMRGIPLSQFHQALAMAYHLNGRDDRACDALTAGLPNQGSAIRDGFNAGGWRGANMAIAECFQRQHEPASSRHVWEHWAAVCFARAGQGAPMYAHLEALLASTGGGTFRDRTAYRNVCFITQAIHADIDFQPYRREPRFQRLKRALEARMAAQAGIAAYESAGATPD
jgi:TolB-like protein